MESSEKKVDIDHVVSNNLAAAAGASNSFASDLLKKKSSDRFAN